MQGKKSEVPCIVCNAAEAEPGDYCDAHGEQVHRLDHQYETFFRLQRSSRGKDHETFDLFLQGNCDPCGRVMVSETDPENLMVTVLISAAVDLNARITEFASLQIERTYGDQLRERIEREIIHSWYGNARACIEIFRVAESRPQHWDVAARERTTEEEEESSEPHPTEGGKRSIH